MKLAPMVLAAGVLACSGNEPGQTPGASKTAADQSQLSQADEGSGKPLEQEVRTDVGTAVSVQQADYTASRTWVAADNDTSPSQLERDLLTRLRSVNPAVNNARLISVMPTWADGKEQFIALVNGTTPDTPHADKFTNLAHAADIYGVFVTNRALTKATRRIGMFVSPRTGDYAAWLIRGRSDSAIVCGHGAMYGDQRARWAFVLDIEQAERARITDSLTKSGPPSTAPEVADPADAEREEYDIPVPADCPWTKSAN